MSNCEELVSKNSLPPSWNVYFAPKPHVLMLSPHLNSSVTPSTGHQADGSQPKFIVALQTCEMAASHWSTAATLASDWLTRSPESVLHTWCQTQGGQLCLITGDTLVPLNFKIRNCCT